MSLATEQATPVAPPERATQTKPIMVAALGNLIEYYDALIYATFSLYFAPAFFPNSDVVVQQIAAAALFAVSFLMRPIGGVLFGLLADKFGRRSSLQLSVIVMSIGSLLIAVLPTYQSVGVWAPILMALARVIQGLSQGGEYGSSVTYLSEISAKNRRGLFSGIWYMTLLGGQLLALMLLLLLQSLLSTAELKSWGWRIPFAVGAALSVFAIYMRKGLPETEQFKKLDNKGRNKTPLSTFVLHWKECLLVIAWTIGGTSAVWTYITYMQKFMRLSVGLSEYQSTLVSGAALLFGIVLQPVYGALSDKIGRKPLLIWFGVLGTFGTYPLLSALKGTTSPYQAFLLMCVGWAIVSGYTSVSAIIKAELFPTAVRALGVGVPYALTVSLFGGTIDMVALSFKSAGHENLFFVYASVCIGISLVFYLFMKESREGTRLEADAHQ